MISHFFFFFFFFRLKKNYVHTLGSSHSGLSLLDIFLTIKQTLLFVVVNDL